MNEFLCPNVECEMHTIPCYLTYPNDDVECGVCGAHGPTVYVPLEPTE